MLNELDPQVKALLEQFQANAAQHPAPATPLSAKEKIIALRQMMGASAARRYPAESVSRTEDFAIPGPAGKIPVRLYVPPRGLRGKNWEPECDPQRHLRPLFCRILISFIMQRIVRWKGNVQKGRQARRVMPLMLNRAPQTRQARVKQNIQEI